LDGTGKKTSAAIHQEVTREIEALLHRVFAERRKSGGIDLEAVEMAIRSALHCAGAAALGQLLHYGPPAPEQRRLPCTCGQQARYLELRTKPVLTALGPIQIERPYYLCPSCHRGQFPVDRELDILNTELSPGVRRMMALVGHEIPFDRGRAQLKLLANLVVTTKAVERTAESIGRDILRLQEREIRRIKQLELPIVAGPRIPILYTQIDGTGVPVVIAETQGRPGKETGQPAHTREAKLGCVFTQTATDADGRPVRDEDSTSYVGAIETAEEFGLRIYTEAWRRGWDRADLKVLMGDGAVWIWNIGDQHFLGAIQIVDLYHAREHLWDLAPKLYPNDAARQKRWIMSAQDKLDNGRIENLVTSLRALRPASTEVLDMVRIEAGYFETNAERMRYPEFRRRGLFVGTGVMEAGCKTVVGSRLKQSGMFWTVRGANAIIALRCCQLSGNFEDFWEQRRA
jgi:hypothetical protein